MKNRIRNILTAMLLALLCGVGLSSCFKDKGDYDYEYPNEVTFLTVSNDKLAFFVNTEVVMEPPISLDDPEIDPAVAFDFEWYIGEELFSTEPVFKHKFTTPGVYKLYLKITDKEGGQIYLSGDNTPYYLTIQSSFEWGWMVLSEKDSKSSLSFIDPDLNVGYDLFEMANDGASLGTGPKNIHYYFAHGSIPSAGGRGLAKVVINQASGSVTLNGETLKEDMYLRQEFAGGVEPAGLDMVSHGAKDYFHAICDRSGDVYLKVIDPEVSDTPFSGSYSVSPFEFTGGGRISVMNGHSMHEYNVGSRHLMLMYDELNGRFIAFYRDNSSDSGYYPTIIYFHKYSDELEAAFPAGVLRVDNMGAGTKVLGIGSYEFDNYNSIPGRFDLAARYVSLIDVGGAGDYYLHKWAVREASLTKSSHLVVEAAQERFAGAAYLTANSVVKMSSSFGDNPYIYFTDGDRNLYVCNIEAGTCKLAYTASSRIEAMYSSPVQCKFAGYGGNSTRPNFRLALSEENGTITVLDVSLANMIKLIEGDTPDLQLARFDGFGDVKGMIWCTRGWAEEY